MHLYFEQWEQLKNIASLLRSHKKKIIIKKKCVKTKRLTKFHEVWIILKSYSKTNDWIYKETIYNVLIILIKE